MYQTVILAVFCAIPVSVSLNGTSYCDQIDPYRRDGVIRIDHDRSSTSIGCNWTIFPAADGITTVRIVHSETTRCYEPTDCCLHVSNRLKTFRKLCNGEIRRPTAISVRSDTPVSIVLEAKRDLELWLTYSVRAASECPGAEFQCADRSSCYGTRDVCSDRFVCQDYSHNLGCAPCGRNETLCGATYRRCFGGGQRCDGVVDCPQGEDELNCTDRCVGMIMCPRATNCIDKRQICDRILDCPSGFDEMNCAGAGTSKSVVILTLFVVCSVCSVLFICLVFRWISSRRDINRLLNDLPEFPLAPFQGPGEQDQESGSSGAFHEADFRQGGEIYESYMMTIKKRSISKSVQAGAGVYDPDELDAENELVVLASLNVPLDSCIGLSVSEESTSELASRGSVKTFKYINNESGSKSSVCSAKAPSKRTCAFKIRRVKRPEDTPAREVKSSASSCRTPREVPPRCVKSAEHQRNDAVVFDPVMVDLLKRFRYGFGDAPKSQPESSDGQWTDIEEPKGTKKKEVRHRSGRKKGSPFKR